MVCKHCGAENSPYVTECPYCGKRLRKRAPKIDSLGDEPARAEPSKPKKAKKAKKARSRPRFQRLEITSRDLPFAVIVAIAAAAVLMLVQRAAGLSALQAGAITPLGDTEWWRYLSAPWVYVDVGFLAVVAGALAIFGIGVERRLGHAAAAVLIVGCGSLGMVAANAVETSLVIAGGNGAALGVLAAWFALARREHHTYEEDEPDLIGVAVCAAVLVVVPLVEGSASFVGGLAGGAVGAVAGLIAAQLRSDATAG